MSKRTIGPFQLEKQLGVGGMGIVYLATYAKTGQKMAVKVLSPSLSANPQLLARFEREIEILKKLQHEHIVRYFGGGKSGGQRFYAMELMTGGSVEDILKEQEKLSWERVIEYGKQICSALEHAHNHGIVHRDLKPANLFLSRDGVLKLGDFGIARDTEATALTAAGKTVGTYAYMAPEQIVGKPPVSRKTDLYALGCVLYEMLTGKTPFEAETPAEMLFQHIEQDPPRVTSAAIDCPIWLEEVIDKLLEKDPDDRYYDALAAHTALDEIAAKVAEQASIAKQTIVGGGATRQTAGSPELQKILGKKKKKKKKQAPFYEQVWFLSACLVFLIGGVTWSLWPLSEDELFARAEVLMSSDDPVDHQTAREKYLEPLLERFPEGRHASDVRQFIDQIEMDLVERRVETNIRFRREPKSEAERLYIEARQYEQFDDRLTALAKYRSLIELLKDREDDRPYVRLAQRKVAELEGDGVQDDDRLQVVNNALLRAEEHAERGQMLKAHGIWNSVVTLYGSNREFEAQVKHARTRLTGGEADLAFPPNDETSEESSDDPDDRLLEDTPD